MRLNRQTLSALGVQSADLASVAGRVKSRFARLLLSRAIICSHL